MRPAFEARRPRARKRFLSGASGTTGSSHSRSSASSSARPRSACRSATRRPPLNTGNTDGAGSAPDRPRRRHRRTRRADGSPPDGGLRRRHLGTEGSVAFADPDPSTATTDDPAFGLGRVGDRRRRAQPATGPAADASVDVEGPFTRTARSSSRSPSTRTVSRRQRPAQDLHRQGQRDARRDRGPQSTSR